MSSRFLNDLSLPNEWTASSVAKRLESAETLYFTDTTGQLACRITNWAVEPSNSFPTFERRLTPTTISSTLLSLANSTRSSPGNIPRIRRWVLQGMFLSVNRDFAHSRPRSAFSISSC